MQLTKEENCLLEQKKLELHDEAFQRELFGNFDKNIKMIEEQFGIHVVLRDGNVVLIGDKTQVENSERLMHDLFKLVQKGEKLTPQTIYYSMDLVSTKSEEKLSDLSDDVIVLSAKGNPIKPKTLGQKEYISNIRNNDITVCIGPAGTGKTYLAVAMAVMAFKREEISRIILTRPAVEAGESLGFLPGDLKDKVDPYLRPLYDALFDIMGADKFAKYMERGMIEVAPLAYMRGRTLDNSFIILDEAQNTTQEQMKMFLTRLGFGSKAVVTGDVTQIDLPGVKKSGLIHATEVLKDVKGIGISALNEKDVVRHELVQRIIKAYEKHEKKVAFKEQEKQANKSNAFKNKRGGQ